MKTRNIIFSVFLSFILFLFILISTLSFLTPRILEKGTFDQVLVQAQIGKKIMGYEYSQNEEKTDIYEFLSSSIPDQVCLALNLSGKEATRCQEGAFSYAKEKSDEKYAYTKMNLFTDDLATGYTQTAIEEKYISPNRLYGYQTLQSGKVYEKESVFLHNSMVSKYRTYIERIADDDLFCSLDLDQKNTFAYLLLTGKDSADMKNELYQKIEEKVDTIYRERYSTLITSLFEDVSDQTEIDESAFSEEIRNIVSEYLSQNGYSEELLNPNITDPIIRNSVQNFIYPRLYENLPSLNSTRSALPETILKGLHLVKNDTLFYMGTGLSVLIMFLVILCSRSKAPFFIGIPILLAGILLFLTKTFTPQLTQRSLSLIGEKGPGLFLPELLEALTSRSSNIGICLLGTSVLFLLFGILLSAKKKKVS